MKNLELLNVFLNEGGWSFVGRLIPTGQSAYSKQKFASSQQQSQSFQQRY